MGRPKLYVPIPVALMEDAEADSIAIAVYAALKRHTDYGEETGARPADATLADLAGCSERSVRNARKFLQKSGWIDWTEKAGTTNRYIVRNEPRHPRPRIGSEPRHQVPTPDDEQLTMNGGSTPAPDADPSPERHTPAGGAEVMSHSEDTPARGAEVPRHEVPTTEYPETEVTDTSSEEQPSSQQPPRVGEATDATNSGDLTMEPDRDQALADANEAMREIQAEIGREFLDSEINRRKLKAGVEMMIQEPLSHWRDPYTGEIIPPGKRPALLRTAILHHLSEPAHNLRASMRYTLKAELDPSHVPPDSEAATAREREARAGGTPRSEDPVNSEALARAGADPGTMDRPKSPIEARIERARAFRQENPDRYVEIRDAAEAAIRDRHTPTELRNMPERILEGMILNEIDARIKGAA